MEEKYERIKELIKSVKIWLEMLADFDDVHWGCGEGRRWLERVEEQKLILELAENAEKYRWHDLRKNPEDLPYLSDCGVCSQFVIVAIDLRDEMFAYDIAYLFKSGEKQKWSVRGNVVAWREIEPYEE